MHTLTFYLHQAIEMVQMTPEHSSLGNQALIWTKTFNEQKNGLSFAACSSLPKDLVLHLIPFIFLQYT